jgi:hypothetical protein
VGPVGAGLGAGPVGPVGAGLGAGPVGPVGGWSWVSTYLCNIIKYALTAAAASAAAAMTASCVLQSFSGCMRRLMVRRLIAVLCAGCW